MTEGLLGFSELSTWKSETVRRWTGTPKKLQTQIRFPFWVLFRTPYPPSVMLSDLWRLFRKHGFTGGFERITPRPCWFRLEAGGRTEGECSGERSDSVCFFHRR